MVSYFVLEQSERHIPVRLDFAFGLWVSISMVWGIIDMINKGLCNTIRPEVPQKRSIVHCE